MNKFTHWLLIGWTLCFIACTGKNSGTPENAPIAETPPIEGEAPKPPAPPAPVVASSRFWLAPAPAMPDVIDLFTDEAKWAKTRSLVKVLQLYGSAVLEEHGCLPCGPIYFSNLRDHGAFDKLREWGIKLSLEVGAIKWGTPEGCDGSTLTRQSIDILRRLHTIGANLHYFVLDNPSISGVEECNMSDDSIARVVAQYTKDVRSVHRELFPNEEPLKFILIDNFVGLRADRMIRLADLMLAKGAFIDGIHPDLDYNHARKLIRDDVLTSELKKLQSHATAKGLEFGILFFGVNGDSDKGFYGDTTAWARKYKRLMGSAPPDSIVQSWAWFTNPDGSWYGRPKVLSETEEYTHTRLLLDMDQIFKKSVPWWSVFTDFPYKP